MWQPSVHCDVCDPSMSALPIVETLMSQSVFFGIFTFCVDLFSLGASCRFVCSERFSVARPLDFFAYLFGQVFLLYPGFGFWHYGRSLLPQASLACGNKAFIATLLCDPSMSAFPIIEMLTSQNVVFFFAISSVSIFTFCFDVCFY